MHCIATRRPPDVAPVVLCLNYEADNASAYKFSLRDPMLHQHIEFQHGQCAAKLA